MGSVGKYCFCYENGVGATLIGFLQLNAMMYFFARFAQIEPYYCWFDLALACLYTIRTTFFFMCVAADYSLASKREYFDMFKWTTFPMVAVSLAIITSKWIDWGHVPTWAVVSHVTVGGFNAYNWFTLKEFAEINGDSWAPYDNTPTSELRSLISSMTETQSKSDGIQWDDMTTKGNKVQ